MSIVSSQQSGFMGYRQSQTMLTAAQLHELLNYNPRTGAFHWKMSAGRAKCGKLAGGSDNTGFRYIRIAGRLYSASRLAWLYVTGKWPKHIIICNNGDRSDLRWTNLRETTFS